MFDNLESCSGAVDLASGHVHTLVDDLTSWPETIILDGFNYDEFAGNSPVTAKARLAWLDKQPAAHSGKNREGNQFRPQPWLHLRNVLRTMGHYEAAREVGVAFETRKRRCGLIGGTPETPSWWCPSWLWPAARRVYRYSAESGHYLSGGLIGFGYRPLKLLFIAAFFWLFFAGVFYGGAEAGVFAPAKTAIFTDHALTACAARSDGKRQWAHCVPPEYPQFYPLVYSLNVLLPVGDLGQEAAWRPMTTTGLGLAIQVAVWFETLFGWIASLILIAVVSGLAKRDE